MPMDRRALEDLCYAVLNVDRGVSLATQVRVAGTSRARRRGLLGVAGMTEDAGLWIAPSEAIHTFGMKVPIDVLFLDREFRIRKMIPKLSPGRIAICIRASSVLELQQGAIARSGTEAGDRLKFEPGSAMWRSGGTQPMSSSSRCL